MWSSEIGLTLNMWHFQFSVWFKSAHLERYILLKTPPESEKWFQSYEELEGIKIIENKKEIHSLFWLCLTIDAPDSWLILLDCNTNDLFLFLVFPFSNGTAHLESPETTPVKAPEIEEVPIEPQVIEDEPVPAQPVVIENNELEPSELEKPPPEEPVDKGKNNSLNWQCCTKLWFWIVTFLYWRFKFFLNLLNCRFLAWSQMDNKSRKLPETYI